MSTLLERYERISGKALRRGRKREKRQARRKGGKEDRGSRRVCRKKNIDEAEVRVQAGFPIKLFGGLALV